MGEAKRRQTIGDAPIEAHLRDNMQHLARRLDEFFNKNKEVKSIGFCLMVFPFEGFDGRCNYISNANRKDVIVLLKEQLARFEGQPEIVGKA